MNDICRFCGSGIHVTRPPRQDELPDWIHDSGYYNCFDEYLHHAEPLHLKNVFEFSGEAA